MTNDDASLAPLWGRVSIAVMAERRQVWVRATLALGLFVFAAGLVEPRSPWETAAFVATAVLVALSAVQLAVIQIGAAQSGRPRFIPATTRPRVLIRLCDPDAAGRPRPRAPGRGPAARPA